AAHEVVNVGAVEPSDDSLRQGGRAGRHRRFDNPGQQLAGEQARRGFVGDLGRKGRGGFEGRLLDIEKGQVESQNFSRERIPVPKLLGPAPARGPRRGGNRSGLLHHIFSTFTRNALNSGALAFASPTKGVSALASQWSPLLRPTNPQWMGMPTW